MLRKVTGNADDAFTRMVIFVSVNHFLVESTGCSETDQKSNLLVYTFSRHHWFSICHWRCAIISLVDWTIELCSVPPSVRCFPSSCSLLAWHACSSFFFSYSDWLNWTFPSCVISICRELRLSCSQQVIRDSIKMMQIRIKRWHSSPLEDIANERENSNQ